MKGWRKFAGKVRGLPPDMALNHDHYLHGLPKKRDTTNAISCTGNFARQFSGNSRQVGDCCESEKPPMKIISISTLCLLALFLTYLRLLAPAALVWVLLVVFLVRFYRP
jgi:hypothetical protein